MTVDAVAILDQKIGDDQKLRQMVAEEVRKLKIAQVIYAARTEAGLTQTELAKRIGTGQPTISRLEDANYGSQSLTMLWKIAEALGKELEIRFVEQEGQNISERQEDISHLPLSELLPRTGDAPRHVTKPLDGMKQQPSTATQAILGC